MHTLIDYFLSHTVQQEWTKMLMRYVVINSVKVAIETEKRRRNSKKIINLVGKIMVGFIVPLNRSRMPTSQGSFMRVKM